MTIFGIEHVMVFAVCILRWTFNTEPRWLKIFKDRRAFKQVKRQEKVFSGAAKTKTD